MYQGCLLNDYVAGRMIRSGGDGSSARKGSGSSAPATASSLAGVAVTNCLVRVQRDR
jgi:hypothetical protein